MKICYVVDNYPPHKGGAERAFEKLVSYMSSKNHEIHVVTTSNTEKYFETINGRVSVFYYPWKKLLDHPIPKAKNIEPHIEWADIVHTSTYSVARTTLKLANKYNKKCLITVYEALGNKWYLIEKNRLLALLFKNYERYILRAGYQQYHAISQATKKDLETMGISSNRVISTYPGIDDEIWNKTIVEANTRKYFNLQPKNKIALFYGRPGKTKGLFVYLDAIKNIRQQIPEEWKFAFILGTEPSRIRQQFINQVRKFKLNNFVIIRDPIPWDADQSHMGIANYVKGSDFVIVPSLTEGFGFCAVETCALGIPIIVSNAGSLPEVVSGQYLMFNKGNSNELSKVLLKAITNKFDKKRQKNFSWDEFAIPIEKAYISLLSK